MITTQQTKTAPVTAKPSYPITLYDPAPLKTFNIRKTEQNTAAKPPVPQKPSAKKSITEKFKQTTKEFQEALLDIYRAGLEYDKAIADIHANIAVPVTNAAIPGLAKILGTYLTYFGKADDSQRKKLFGILFQQCKTDLGKSGLIKSDKRTTEWHLLSRMFRRSDRRQASADAKILKFAHAEGVTEESFAPWVKKYGTLSNILKGIPADSPEDHPKPRTTKISKPFTKWVKAAEIPDNDPLEALAALKRLADGKQYTVVIHHHKDRFDIMRLVNADPSEEHKDRIDCAGVKPKEENRNILLLTFDPKPIS